MRRVLATGGCGLGLLLAAPGGAAAAGGPVTPFQGGAGATAPGGHVAFVAVGTRDRTVVQRIERRGGAVTHWRVLRGSFGVPGVAYDGSTTGLSADGRTLVLAAIDRRYPPRSTRLLVLDPERLSVRARLRLPGWFSVDSIAPDGRSLGVIRYRSGDPLDYEVRAYDLERRRLEPDAIVDKDEPDEQMAGVPITRATSADGRWAYTLYQRPEGEPFIHALDVQDRHAECIDLPMLEGVDDLTRVKLKLSAGDGAMTVRNAEETVAVVDTTTFAARRPAPAPKVAAPAPAPRSPADDDGTPWPLLVIPPAVGVAVLAALGLSARRRRAGAPSRPAPRP
jgi:hypothetical protein